jgi:hypothetical protein
MKAETIILKYLPVNQPNALTHRFWRDPIFFRKIWISGTGCGK